MALLYAILLLLVLLAAWLLTLLGMPGNWLMLAATAIYAFFMPPDSAAAIGWPVVIALAALAGLGELLELLTVTAGAAKAGGSKIGALTALAGSIAGGVLGVFVGLPIPMIGSLIGVLLFASLGAMAGAVFGEWMIGRNLGASLHVGKAAFWGRLLGTLGKMLVGAVMVVVAVAAMIL